MSEKLRVTIVVRSRVIGFWDLSHLKCLFTMLMLRFTLEAICTIHFVGFMVAPVYIK